MALQGSGAISLNEIAAEFGGTAPHSMSEYLKGGDNVPSTLSGSSTVDASTTLGDNTDFGNLPNFTYNVSINGGSDLTTGFSNQIHTETTVVGSATAYPYIAGQAFRFNYRNDTSSFTATADIRGYFTPGTVDLTVDENGDMACLKSLASGVLSNIGSNESNGKMKVIVSLTASDCSISDTTGDPANAIYVRARDIGRVSSESRPITVQTTGTGVFYVKSFSNGVNGKAYQHTTTQKNLLHKFTNGTGGTVSVDSVNITTSQQEQNPPTNGTSGSGLANPQFALVYSNVAINANVPTRGKVSMTDFYGGRNT